MSSPFRYLTREEAAKRIAETVEEVVLIENVSSVFPLFEVAPLIPKRTSIIDDLACVLMDMDGTTTTTENLCLDALETMIRRMAGREGDPSWAIDGETDHPNLIGNSATKHVEYLVRKYGHHIRQDDLEIAYLRAAAYGLATAPDAQRRREILENAELIGVRHLVDRDDFARWGAFLAAEGGEAEAHTRAHDFLRQIAGQLRLDTVPNRVRAGLDIYYHRYHHLMSNLAGYTGGPPLISPMPGVGVLLALLKGALGSEAEACVSLLAQDSADLEVRERLRKLGERFDAQPVRVALVTSSTGWETEQILGEVFRQLGGEIAGWPLSGDVKKRVSDRLASHRSYFDTIVTASDATEMRLKPHRDLYAIAVERLGLSPDERDRSIGFEDSAVGCLALRAAGIGLACALPWMEQDYTAASVVCPGGLPEAMIHRNLFLSS